MEGVKALVAIFLLMGLACAQVGDPEGWLAYQKGRIDEVGEDPTIDQLRTLTRLASNEPDNDHKAAARELALQKLRSIPDFPERIRDHILEKKEQWRKREIFQADYISARDSFWPLGGVPYPGVVRVLGEFLYDDEWPDGESLAAKLNGLYPNSMGAMRALGGLIEKPPVKGGPLSYKLDDVAIWQLWYEQVKAGNRTFRFKGDPQEYSLAGPVSGKAVGVAPTGAASSDVASKASADVGKHSGSLPVWPLILACGLLAVAVWSVAKRKPAES